jgi:hypothetical protein
MKPKKKTDTKREELQEFLLKGPVMDDEQYQDFLDNRKHLDSLKASDQFTALLKKLRSKEEEAPGLDEITEEVEIVRSSRSVHH